MKIFNYILLAILLVFTSCDDYLNEPPSKSDSIDPQTTADLEFLLNSYSSNQSEKNKDFINCSDDYGLIKDIYDDNNAVYNITPAQYATWDVEYLPVTEDRGYFSSEWPKVFSANFILHKLPDVSGTEAEKAALKQEAHFLRAYSYVNMVNTYCLPYAAENMDEMGLPIKNSTSFDVSYERASLQATWDFIIADLEEALKLDRELELVSAGYRSWRASTASVNAFAARVYLIMGNYAKAQSHAQKALDEHDELVDYNTEMSYDPITEDYTDEDGNTYTVQYPITRAGQGATDLRMEWKELYYFRFMENDWWWYIPSQELLDAYDQTNDLRYKYHMVEHYSFNRGLTKFDYPGYMFFFDAIPSGPTVAEMLLVKAECQARLGQWNDGITTANRLRVVRMDNTADPSVINLSATDQDDAIAKILEERRRELPYTQRFSDVRRFNYNNYPADDVVITREFYPVSSVIESSQPVTTHVLDKKSRKYARPLPQQDINLTLGAMKQNTY